jgi:hypothetical protein
MGPGMGILEKVGSPAVLRVWSGRAVVNGVNVSVRTRRRRRTGKMVLIRALNHLQRVFVMSPNRVKLAPSSVEIRMNPDDLASLAEEMEVAAAADFASVAYRSAILKHGARVTSAAPLDVRISADESVPAGRYRIVPRPESGNHYAPSALAQNPVLRLITDNEVTESQISGVHAGRSKTVEFVLPVKRTVSRVHARFTVVDGEWYITGLGVNGILVNDRALTGVQMLYDGDVLSWGRTADAPTSRVEILP